MDHGVLYGNELTEIAGIFISGVNVDLARHSIDLINFDTDTVHILYNAFDIMQRQDLKTYDLKDCKFVIWRHSLDKFLSKLRDGDREKLCILSEEIVEKPRKED